MTFDISGEQGASVADALADAGNGAPPPEVRRIQGRNPWVLAISRLRRDKVAVGAFIVIVLVILVAIFAPVFATITGHGVDQQFRTTGLTPLGQPVGPSGHFLFGTDDQGRDILVRIAYGARMSLIVGVFATLITVAGGTVIGLAAGYFGGIVDSILARFMDWLLAIPFLLLAISLASVVDTHPIGPIGPGLPIVLTVLGVFGWSTVGRIVRGQVLSIREREYIEAARAQGAGPWRIMFIDILPNIAAQLIVYTTLLIPTNIVGEASLSFLGVGIQPPTADWGQMISEASNVYLYGSWWYMLFPCIAVIVTTLAFNIFGDGVRDAFDPRAQVTL
jgi:peptide/nickel transport system permease protein